MSDPSMERLREITEVCLGYEYWKENTTHDGYYICELIWFTGTSLNPKEEL